MIPQYELKSEDIRAFTSDRLKGRVKLDVTGYRCTTEVILDVLLKASAESSSIEAARLDLKDVADSHTIRENLNTVLEAKELRQQESGRNDPGRRLGLFPLGIRTLARSGSPPYR
jgi:hypothetical protein